MKGPHLWIPSFRPDRHATLRLFCLPYAGGNSQVFHSWKEYLPPRVDVCPIELPGHGSRIREPLIKDADRLLEALYVGIQPYLDMEFVFFGHSMGAQLAFGLAHILRQSHGPEPSHLFLSGQKPPQLPRSCMALHELPDAALAKELGRLNGTSQKVLNDKDLMQVLLPILRADYSITETFEHPPGSPLSCGITLFGGLADPEACRQELGCWQEHTSSSAAIFMLPGDHFFIHSSQGLLLRVLTRKIGQLPAHRPVLHPA